MKGQLGRPAKDANRFEGERAEITSERVRARGAHRLATFRTVASGKTDFFPPRPKLFAAAKVKAP
jgi:hypothetical protein